MSTQGKTLTRVLLGSFAILVALGGPRPASAEKFYTFFHNHPDLDWYVIHTEHFNVFYPVSKVGPEENRYYVNGEDVARKTAMVCEEMYAPTCSQYDLYIEETVNVVLLEQTDDLAGFTVPNYDWIVISGRHDDFLWRWRGHGDWIRDVMYHEYAHVISLKKDNVFAQNSFGWWISTRYRDGAYNTDTGITMLISDGDPWWWVEGGAEYTSEVAGINTWNSNRDMWMRADILEGTLLDKEDWEDYYGRNSWMDGERHYNSGYNFAVYLDEQYGEGIYQSFAKTRDENGWTANWDRVVEDTLGVTVEELREGWIQWATAKYTKVQTEVMAEPAIGGELRYQVPDWERPEDAEERIEFEKKRDFKKVEEYEKSGSMRHFPRYSPDGRFLADYEVRGDKLTLRAVDEEVWMPMRRAYLDDEDDEEFVAELGKLSSTLSGRETGWIGGSGQFDWSPDGSQIVTQCADHFTTKVVSKMKLARPPRGYGNFYTLCVLDVTDCEAAEAEGEGEGDEEIEEPEGCDEETRVVFDVDRQIPGAFRAADPSWSPDGEWIAYTAFASGNQVLTKIRVDDESMSGETKVALTPWDDGTEIEMVDWSPDGTQLVFGAYRHHMQDLWIVNADGTGLHPITQDRHENREPLWADDGMIYFSSDRVGGIYNIYRFNPDAEIGWKDTDGDGFADSEDGCPEEAENFNRWRDRDGCPDELPVRITAERVEIGEKIHFELGTANLSPESHPILDLVAMTLSEHPELGRIEVAGHTDVQGNRRDNQTLSEDRAQSVASYLSSKGVGAERLASRGYGQTRPVVDEKTEEAYAMNRRVEFVILERTTAQVARPGGEEGERETDQVDRPEGAEAAVEEETEEIAYAVPELPDEMPDKLHIVREYTPEILAAKATADEMENAALIQLTNVLYGAFTPSITPRGNLLYSYYTAYGWKLYGLNKEDFYNHVVDDTALAIAPEDIDIGPQEEWPTYADSTEHAGTGIKYLQPPAAIPILSLENNSRSHMAFSGGVAMWGADYLGNHFGYLEASFGEYMSLRGHLMINKWAPTFYFGALYAQYKYDFAYRWDEDEDPSTVDDIFQGDIKGMQSVYGGYGGMFVNVNPNVELGFSNFTYGSSSADPGDGLVGSPIYFHLYNSFWWALSSFTYDSFYYGDFSINPRGGGRIAASASLNYTNALYESTHGVIADDGEIFDKYVYPEFDFTAIGYIKAPWAEKYRHTVQLELQLGMIPMNVPYWDEFVGGGSSSLGYRNPWTTNSAFSGYEPWSLRGEMKGLINAAYRLPVVRNLDKKFGVLYLESIYLQFFTTWGNFWSYHVRDGAETYDFVFGDPVAYDSDDVIPELPFSDRLESCPTDVKLRNGGECGRSIFPVAQKNGNRILGDIGVELRIRANLFNRSSWNSFIRLAYGFQETGGIWDVDGDDIVTNVSDPNVGSLSSEREKPSLRLYIGLGTGW